MALRYFKSREIKGRAMDMFPPGRIVFIRPIKQVDEHGKKKGHRGWDTVWVQPMEIIGEGILVSPRVSYKQLKHVSKLSSGFCEGLLWPLIVSWFH